MGILDTLFRVSAFQIYKLPPCLQQINALLRSLATLLARRARLLLQREMEVEPSFCRRTQTISLLQHASEQHSPRAERAGSKTQLRQICYSAHSNHSSNARRLTLLGRGYCCWLCSATRWWCNGIPSCCFSGGVPCFCCGQELEQTVLFWPTGLRGYCKCY